MHLPNSETILIMAPTGRDSTLLSEALRKQGFSAEIFEVPKALCERINTSAGALIVAEEALSENAISELNACLTAQEPWSDLPVILMTVHGEASFDSMNKIKAFLPAGNVTLLERPFRSMTLVNAVTVALRSRRRQYQMRELLQTQIKATLARDEFISIASHELKTPLTSLKLMLQINERFAKNGKAAAFDPERINKLVASAHRQVDRLGRLVEDMLDVSRINGGKLIIQKSETDLSELVRDVTERISPQYEAAKTELIVETPSPVIGEWDRYRIEQVVINLLTNALRYAAGKPVFVSAEDGGAAAILKVRDSGKGISREDQKRVFGRFERAVSSTNISGLGLGLYISKEIAERHSGTIRVESELGQGATFIVELPKHVQEKHQISSINAPETNATEQRPH